MIYDVAIVGGGPAGSSCAAFCAAKGLRTIVFEREKFPREKVCGDCINPLCWPVLRRLGVAKSMREARRGVLDRVDFVNMRGERLSVKLPQDEHAEIAIKRSLFDFILLENARKCGAEILDGTTVRAIARSGAKTPWQLTVGNEEILARYIVAADGRNSTAGRLLGVLPRVARDRVALQAHVPLPTNFGNRVVLQLLPGGYSGQAPVSESELNLCLVGRAATLPRLREWAAQQFGLSPKQQWRTVTPLTRRSIPPTREDLFFIGDAARVVEPFTGEGIAYALHGGEIAAEMIHRLHCGANAVVARQQFRRAHAAIYRGRLWINAMTRTAVVSPRMGSALFQLARLQPVLLRFLTGRITGITQPKVARRL